MDSSVKNGNNETFIRQNKIQETMTNLEPKWQINDKILIN
jgi:hypothetical protein